MQWLEQIINFIIICLYRSDPKAIRNYLNSVYVAIDYMYYILTYQDIIGSPHNAMYFT